MIFSVFRLSIWIRFDGHFQKCEKIQGVPTTSTKAKTTKKTRLGKNYHDENSKVGYSDKLFQIGFSFKTENFELFFRNFFDFFDSKFISATNRQVI